MIDLIRSLLDRPLDPRHARAVVVIACCLTLTFAALVGFTVIGGSRPVEHETRTEDSSRPTAPPPVTVEGPSHVSGTKSPPAPRRQDPQDRRGSAAYRRARRTLRENRALQHLPFRRRGLSISLAGADRGRAVIRILAPTVSEAKRRWRHFLRRSGDDGSSYETRFRARPRLAVGRRRKVVGGAAGGFAGPDAGRGGENAGKRHHKPHRGARSFLKSLPQPKASP